MVARLLNYLAVRLGLAQQVAGYVLIMHAQCERAQTEQATQIEFERDAQRITRATLEQIHGEEVHTA